MGNSKIVDSAILTGFGVGVSAEINLQGPFPSYAWSTQDDPGGGSNIYESPFCREPVTSRTFEGMCVAVSGDAVLPRGDGLAGRQASATILVFGDRLGVGSISPTSINAVAFVSGLGNAAINFGGAGAEVAYYRLKAKQDPDTIGAAR